MCDHCDCQAISTIATLIREHDDVLDLLGTASRALRAQDDTQLQVSCGALTALLGPHTAVEEQGLFPALADEFPDQIARLVDEHRASGQAIAEAGSTDTRRPGWEARFERAVNDLHRHIRKEEDGVFPAALSTLTPAQWDRLDQVRAACIQSGQSGQMPPRPLKAPLDLRTRDDVDELLVAFYSTAMNDDLLGPVFAAARLDLQAHLPRIGDFWERSLFGSVGYDGQPMVVHRRLHHSVPLTPTLFERWLGLWSEAVDRTWSGPVADRAKSTAIRVAAAMQRQLDDPRRLLQVVAPTRAS